MASERNTNSDGLSPSEFGPSNGARAPLGVIGGGAWGTALAVAAARAGNDVVLWSRDPAAAAQIAASRRNARYLPDISLPPALHVTGTDGDLAGCDLLLLAVPAQHLRAVLARLAPHLPPAAPLVACAKGIEIASGLLVPDLLRGLLPGRRLAMLSGPTFAAEVAAGLPSAAILAAADLATAQALAARLARPELRLYASDDLTGAAVGGAVKNVLAIACGIAAGRGFGDNARAALITRGLAELLRFGVSLGARPETLMGLAGVGDLVLTCSSRASRNFAFGVALGQGSGVAQALTAGHGVVEGAASAPVLRHLATARGVDMPIAGAVAAVLAGEAELHQAIADLLARPAGMEYPLGMA